MSTSNQSNENAGTITRSRRRRNAEDLQGLVGVDQRTRTRVLMNYLTAAMVTGVPDEFATTAEERLQLRQDILAQLAERQADTRCATTSAVTTDIVWNALTRNPAYQREKVLKVNKVARMVNCWRPLKYKSLSVAMIPVCNDDGAVVDVLFEVADGWHRRCSLVQLMFAAGRQDFTLTCEITPCEDVTEAAAIFSAANNPDEKGATTSKDQWKSASVEGQADVVAVNEMCAEYGLDARCTNRAKGWPNIDFGFAIRNALQNPKIGPEVVRRVLELYGDETLLGLRAPKLEHVPNVLTAQMFVGFCKFIALFERPGFAHDAVIRRMLADQAFLLRMRYHLETMSLETIANVIGFSVSRQNEEHVRQWKIVAALAMMYEDYVVKPRSSKTSLWPECPMELRSLFHTIRGEEDKQRRMQRVAQMHRALVRMGMTPRFEVRVSRAINR